MFFLPEHVTKETEDSPGGLVDEFLADGVDFGEGDFHELVVVDEDFVTFGDYAFFLGEVFHVVVVDLDSVTREETFEVGEEDEAFAVCSVEFLEFEKVAFSHFFVVFTTFYLDTIVKWISFLSGEDDVGEEFIAHSLGESGDVEAEERFREGWVIMIFEDELTEIEKLVLVEFTIELLGSNVENISQILSFISNASQNNSAKIDNESFPLFESACTIDDALASVSFGSC